MNARLIDINEYELSGGGKLGESYIRRDNPDVLLKLYSTRLEAEGLEDYARACKVYRIGVPCPEPGELVRTGDGRLGILYKRIVGKKSYARALSEHPELVDTYAVAFARLTRELHSTKPEPGLFPSAKEQYVKGVYANPYLSSDEKKRLERYIDALPDGDTAVHGDLHHGNAIFTEDGKQYFIDLGDFCTGTPYFDLGIVYLQTCLVPEEIEQELYHIGLPLSKAFWKTFVAAYFGPDIPLEEVAELLKPYAVLRILVVERATGVPFPFIRPELRSMIY